MKKILDARNFGLLFSALQVRGWQVVGPKVKGGVISYEYLKSPADLPQGITDEQGPGNYKLIPRSDQAYFGYNLGPSSWKRFLQKPREKILESKKDKKGFKFSEPKISAPKLAFLGVRACELAAIDIQDKVFLRGAVVKESYKERRKNIFVIAVQCTTSASSCFCVSMGTGPVVKSGFDLALTEVVNAKEHFLVLEAGSKDGNEILDALDLKSAVEQDLQKENKSQSLALRQVRSMNPQKARAHLQASFEHTHWEEIGKRCLSCANCTLVCPTCFCSTVEDTQDVTGNHAQRWERWDSCFNSDFSYVHGGSVRPNVAAKYRQWMTHKLSSWFEQFGSSGCVGCGRCVSWCPVGIDLTEEIKKFE